jgi:hypothetical protein
MWIDKCQAGIKVTDLRASSEAAEVLVTCQLVPAEIYSPIGDPRTGGERFASWRVSSMPPPRSFFSQNVIKSRRP